MRIGHFAVAMLKCVVDTSHLRMMSNNVKLSRALFLVNFAFGHPGAGTLAF
jgi:hypothetical protein